MKNYRHLSAIFVALLCITTGAQASYADEAAVTIDLETSHVIATSPENQVSSGDSSIYGDVLFSDEDSQITIGDSSENSLQLVISIDSAQAPSEYSFLIPGLKGIENLRLNGRTIHRLVGENDSTLGWLAEAWAHDAGNRAVDTYFSVSGQILTQHVATNSEWIQFPVTADPYLGKSLISYVSKDLVSGVYNVHVKVSSWMWEVYGIYTVGSGVVGYTTAYQIAVNYGWSEVLDKISAKYGVQFRGYVATKLTYEDQFDCHAFGAPALYYGVITGKDPHPTWDLEGYRSHVQNAGVWVVSACQW